jgi:hypothetical protein
MKVYTYSAARAKLSAVLEESKSEEIVIKRRKGDLYVITPKTSPLRSPFDIPPSGLTTNITADDIVSLIRESRARRYAPYRKSRKSKKSLG